MSGHVKAPRVLVSASLNSKTDAALLEWIEKQPMKKSALVKHTLYFFMQFPEIVEAMKDLIAPTDASSAEGDKWEAWD